MSRMQLSNVHVSDRISDIGLGNMQRLQDIQMWVWADVNGVEKFQTTNDQSVLESWRFGRGSGQNA